MLHKTGKPKLTRYWWNRECEIAKRRRQNALRKYEKNKTPETLAKYRTERNRTNAVIKRAKLAAWKDFTSSIDITTGVKDAWDSIRKIKGSTKVRNDIPVLEAEGTGIKAMTDKEKANLLADQYYMVSSTSDQTEKFTQIKEVENEDS